MKKLISVLLAVLLLTALAACGGETAPVQSPEETPAATISATETEAPADSDPSANPVVLRSAAPTAAASYAQVFETFCQAEATDSAVLATGAFGAADDLAVAEKMEESASESNQGGAAAYSGTNVQVNGVDEGDIVKTDGEYIYMIRDGVELLVLDAEGADTRPVAWVNVGYSSYSDSAAEEKDGGYSGEYKNASEMFVSGDRLIVLGSYNYYHSYMLDEAWQYDSEEYAFADIYDISDPTAPMLLNSLGQDGYLTASRLLDGKIYAVTNYWVWDQQEDAPETFIPALYRNGVSGLISADCIYLCPGSSSEYCVICEYDLTSGEITASRSILGSGSEVYMNADSIYLLGSEYTTESVEEYEESVYHVTHYLNTSVTSIYRFDLDGGLHLAASGSVPGNLDSQFSVDAYAGNLRIVTTRSDSEYRLFTDEDYGFTNYQWEDSSSSTGLYILDDGLNIIGSVENLAEGEYVYSARFEGDIAYFCTFRTVDPLFAVDLRDPSAPEVLSALKISGFSDYLHPWDSDHLFGFGLEADEDSGGTEELKLVMFDISDKTDVTVEHVLELDASYSEALYNHKAFFIDSEKNIIGFAGDGDYYVFSYDPDEGFTELSHFNFAYSEWNVRGLWIDNFAYIVGQETVSVLDMSRWGEPETILLGWG